MNVDWRSLRAVVFESDDWGLCAWCPDAATWSALQDAPVFRSPVGRRYGGSTLESAEDVRSLTATLAEVRGRDGFPPVWQANTIVANPDYAKVDPDDASGELPLLPLPGLPSRWERPGLWDEIGRAIAAGMWWPELHGLHHLPEQAWRDALKSRDEGTRRAFDVQSPACTAVQNGGEYDPFEPAALRERNLALAVRHFETVFGRPPASLCPPDYRWDGFLEVQSEALGIRILQGKSEQHDVFASRLRRAWRRRFWPQFHHRQLYMPERIAFEPAMEDPRRGVEAVQARVRAAWGRGQPAVVSSHRVNYAHLDADLSRTGRAALRDLVGRLAGDGAIFLTDAEVSQLVAQGSSVRPLGSSGARLHSPAGGTLVWPAPPGASTATFVAGPAEGAQVTVSGGRAEARLPAGDFEIAWSHA